MAREVRERLRLDPDLHHGVKVWVSRMLMGPTEIAWGHWHATRHGLAARL